MSEGFIIFSKPFVEAARNVFETMLSSKLETGKPYLKKVPQTSGDVSAVMGLAGEVKRGSDMRPYAAQLVLSWPMSTYLKIASSLLCEEHKEFSEEISDTGAEICNMIMGNAKRHLVELNYTCSMAIPSTIIGVNHQLKYPQNSIVIVIPVTSSMGEMFIEVCYKE